MKKSIASLILLGTMAAGLADAQDSDRYTYCQSAAQRASNYYGDVPDEHLAGGLLKGAIKGGATGGLIGIIGGKKVDTGKAAKNAAILGGLIGAIRRGKAKDEQRQKRERYYVELNACMAGG